MTNLKVRVHFKKQLQARSDIVSITNKEKEKEREKSVKVVARLEKKLVREEEALARLVVEAAATNGAVHSLVSQESSQSWKGKFAKAELARMEVEAKTKVDASVIKTMGNKLEMMDSDLNSALEMLRKDHMCCRGHDISTKEDKKAYEELKDKLLGHNVTWGGLEDDQGASGSLGTPGGSAKESPYVKYQEAARLDLPCLRTELVGELPDNEVQDETSLEKEAPEINLVPETSSEPLSSSPDMVPGTPQTLRQVRAAPQVTVEGTPQLHRAISKAPQPKVSLSLNISYQIFLTLQSQIHNFIPIRCKTPPSLTLPPPYPCPTTSRSQTPPPPPSPSAPPSSRLRRPPSTCPILSPPPPWRLPQLCLRPVLRQWCHRPLSPPVQCLQ